MENYLTKKLPLSRPSSSGDCFDVERITGINNRGDYNTREEGLVSTMQVKKHPGSLPATAHITVQPSDSDDNLDNNPADFHSHRVSQYCES